jgi:plastocyanin
MSTIIDNPRGINAAIVFNGKDLKAVIPDEIEVDQGEPVEWEVESTETVVLSFGSDSPVEWNEQESSDNKIKGTIKREAHGVYKYTVSDIAGNITIDPRIRIKK